MRTKTQTYFDDYPGSDQCFETEDGVLFHQQSDAELHRRETLKSKEPVRKYKRAELAKAAAQPTEATEAETLIGEEAPAKKPQQQTSPPVRKNGRG